jgi:hypothetical protein
MLDWQPASNIQTFISNSNYANSFELLRQQRCLDFTFSLKCTRCTDFTLSNLNIGTSALAHIEQFFALINSEKGLRPMPGLFAFAFLLLKNIIKLSASGSWATIMKFSESHNSNSLEPHNSTHWGQTTVILGPHNSNSGATQQ